MREREREREGGAGEVHLNSSVPSLPFHSSIHIHLISLHKRNLFYLFMMMSTITGESATHLDVEILKSRVEEAAGLGWVLTRS